MATDASTDFAKVQEQPEPQLTIAVDFDGVLAEYYGWKGYPLRPQQFSRAMHTQRVSRCQDVALRIDYRGMSTARTNRDRYRVIFAKDAQELEAKLNDPNFVPIEYTITHLTFNSGR